MRWTTKARVHRLTSAIPLGHRLNGLLQRHVSHSYPRSDDRLVGCVERARTHLDALTRGGLDFAQATLFEFGAGWDLAIPLAMAAHGVRNQIVIDQTPLRSLRLVSDVAARLASDPERYGSPASDPTWPVRGEHLLRARGIEYKAPYDARRTDLPSASVDAVTSTNTLEHVSALDIPQILREVHRILRPGGLVSFLVDYSDHYSHSDPTITPYNFLRFTESEWERYNPRSHFQNRLRHSDHLRLLNDAGLEVLEERPMGPGPEAVEDLELAEQFRSYEPTDLAITAGWFLARRPL